MLVRNAALALMVFAVAALGAWPQEEALSAPSSPAAEESQEILLLDAPPPPPSQLSLTYDQYYETKGERTIQEEISVDLIDLDALRQAIESRSAENVLRLSLDECIAIALRQNPDIQIAQFGPVKSDGDIKAARGEFDPFWQSTAMYLRSSSSASQDIRVFGGGISSIDSYRTTFNTALGGKLQSGTQYSLAFDMTKEESTFGGFIEEFSGRLTLTLTQPLLRGMSWKANRSRIMMARNMRGLTEEQLRLEILNTVSNVVKAYWDLVGAVEALKVREDSLANAERLLQINETRREIGTAADIEVLQAKAGVASRQSELISARSQVANAGDILKQMLDLRDGDFFSKAQLSPTDRPNVMDQSLLDPMEFDRRLDESIALALKNRPEITIMGQQVKNAQLDEFRAKQDMLPEVNVVGSLTSGGRNHYFRQMVYGIRDNQDWAYSLGVQATVPIGNRAARGAHLRAKLSRREMEEREKQAELGMMLNVHLALRNLITNQILVESNRQTLRLQEANVVAEEKRLRLGVTTSWQLLKVQEDLTAAQVMELQARIAYEKALVDLRLAEGMLLDALGVEVDIPERERPMNYFISILPKKFW